MLISGMLARSVPSVPVCLDFITRRRHTFYMQKCTQKVKWISVIHTAFKKNIKNIKYLLTITPNFYFCVFKGASVIKV